VHISVLQQYNLNPALFQAKLIGSGLIHQTWKLSSGNKAYVLQQINHHVFKNPYELAENIQCIKLYLQKNAPDYFFAAPLETSTGSLIAEMDGAYYRLVPFVNGSVTIHTVTTPKQAYEAAAQFAKFTHRLKSFDSTQLEITIPQFHDLSYRYQQLMTALDAGNSERIKQAGELLAMVGENLSILHQYQSIRQNKNFRLRVTHHDTKISNVLFNSDDKGLCVIDLDTVMPGWFISDVGDMMRTYLSPINEEGANFEDIEVRTDIYKAIVEGYCSEMKNELSSEELRSFVYSGKFMIYMQAIRFLTDYLNNDAYYGASYELHNYKRAKNQLTLLQRLFEQEQSLSVFMK
jgi:Ser/Thr protein kinase RdoA (MazF antagonist)